MRRLNWLLLSGMLLCLSATHAQGQSPIDASRRIDWSQAGVSGGIPNRTTICATLNSGATAAQINSALSSCPANQVVFLNAGTYILSSGISFSGRFNVTLRGAGANLTILNFTGSSGCIIQSANVCLAGPSFTSTGNPGTVRNWTSGYAKGSTQITLDSTSGLSVNSFLILDQLNDTADTGNVLVSNSPSFCSTCQSPGRTNRSQQQFVKVTAINGNTVTITPGIHMPNWRSSQSPQVWSPGVIGTNIGTRNGLENLTVDGRGGSSSSNVEIGNCYECWVKGITSLRTQSRNHIWLWQSIRAEVRDSYIYGSAGTSQAYGVESFMTSDSLVINNIFQRTTGAMTTANTAGSVFAYNYALDNYYTVSPTWMIKDLANHNAGIGMVLYEGNVANGFTQDTTHGTQNFVTVFRNQLEGWQTGKTNSTVAVHIEAFNRYANVVGNVLGRAGYQTTYQAGSSSVQNTSIYSLGFNMGGDNLVATTLLRWGNYDTVTGTSRFVGAEVPSGLSAYANPVPSSQNLPASLFLSTRPSWWNTNIPWPPIGPDVTGGSGPGGHVHAIPAKACFDNTPRISGILDFSAARCYISGLGAPTPPYNVRILR